MEASTAICTLLHGASPCQRILDYSKGREVYGNRKVLAQVGQCYLLPHDQSSIDDGDIEDLLKTPTITNEVRSLLEEAAKCDTAYPKGRRPCVAIEVDKIKRIVVCFPFATYNKREDFNSVRSDAREISVPVYPFTPLNYDGIHVHSTPELHPDEPSADKALVQYVTTRAIVLQNTIALEPYTVRVDGVRREVKFDKQELEILEAHREQAEIRRQAILSDVEQSTTIARSLAESRRRSIDTVSIGTQGSLRGRMSLHDNFGTFARKSSVMNSGRRFIASDRHTLAHAVPEGEELHDLESFPIKQPRMGGDSASVRTAAEATDWRRSTQTTEVDKENAGWTNVSHKKKLASTRRKVSFFSVNRLGVGARA